MNKTSILDLVFDLIRVLFNFFFNRNKKQEEKFEQNKAELKEKFEKVDKETEAKKNEDLDKRLKNLF